MAQKTTVPPAFRPPGPSVYINPKNPSPSAAVTAIFGDAYVEMAKLTYGQNVKTNLLVQSAHQYSARLTQMIDEYQGALTAIGMTPPLRSMDTWPWLSVNAFGPDIYDLINDVVKDGQLRSNAARQFTHILLPQANNGVLINRRIRTAYEVTNVSGTDEKVEFSVTIHIYSATPAVRPAQNDRDLIAEFDDTKGARIIPLHAGCYKVCASYDKTDNGLMPKVQLEQTANLDGSELLSAIRPKALGWSRTDVRLWEKTVLQTIVDTGIVNTLRYGNNSAVFLENLLNCVLLRNICLLCTDDKEGFGLDGITNIELMSRDDTNPVVISSRLMPPPRYENTCEYPDGSLLSTDLSKCASATRNSIRTAVQKPDKDAPVQKTKQADTNKEPEDADLLNSLSKLLNADNPRPSPKAAGVLRINKKGG